MKFQNLTVMFLYQTTEDLCFVDFQTLVEFY